MEPTMCIFSPSASIPVKCVDFAAIGLEHHVATFSIVPAVPWILPLSSGAEKRIVRRE
jgi:hypothetical protein